MKRESIVSIFKDTFSNEPSLVINSPGRINLIGEHIDYNDGFVLPASIDKSILFAIAPNEASDICTLKAIDINQTFQFTLSNINHTKEKSWANYILGVINEMQKVGITLSPFNCVFGGNIPTGAGLSSSAAVECGIAFALNELFQLGLSRLQMVQFSKQAENNFVGVNCGIMDQFASSFGKENHVIKLDCLTLEYEYFPFNLTNYDIVLCDTGVKHSLGDSEYNTRRQECDTAIAILKEQFAEIKNYRDVRHSHIESLTNKVPLKTIDRVKFVVEEIARVGKATTLLSNHDLVGFGKLMYEAHDGLSNLYEVSCPELDFLNQVALESNIVFGSRMMGGGFGGCTINLLLKENTQSFIQKATEAYYSKYQLKLKTYIVDITNGTSLV